MKRLVVHRIHFLILFSYTGNEQKENPMSTIAIAFFILVRVIIPFGLLITIGEWMRRREIKYWFHR
jgi:hypothetical protein